MGFAHVFGAKSFLPGKKKKKEEQLAVDKCSVETSACEIMVCRGRGLLSDALQETK